jgi:hypothetical protein
MGNCLINRVTPLGLASSPELKLWRAVLAVAASDALNTSIWDGAGNYRNPKTRNMDREYFLSPNRSFYMVCRNAGYDPEYVIRKMKRRLCEDQSSVPNVVVMDTVKFGKIIQKQNK